MKYTVIWRPLAEGKLAELWSAASDREAVGAAADEIDVRLGQAPQTEGESRWGATRILLVPPLAVY
jgi:hypothetical protein